MSQEKQEKNKHSNSAGPSGYCKRKKSQMEIDTSESESDVEALDMCFK